MRVRAIKDNFVECSPQVAAFGSSQTSTFITVGKAYEVYAMSIYLGVLFLQIINDVELIDWDPACFFETVDPSLPQDWICNVFEGDVAMIIGPKFIAGAVSSYIQMVELDKEMVERFRRRLDNNQRNTNA